MRSEEASLLCIWKWYRLKKKTNNKHQCTVNLTGLAHSMRLYSVLQLHLFQYSWILLNFIYALWKSLHWLQFVINYNKIHFFLKRF